MALPAEAGMEMTGEDSIAPSAAACVPSMPTAFVCAALLSERFIASKALGTSTSGTPVIHKDAGADAQPVGKPGLLTELKSSETNTCAFALFIVRAQSNAHSSSIFFKIMGIKVVAR